MTSALDLSPRHLKEVQAILARHVPNREVWAFGSRVTGNAKPTSDLDLCILGQDPLLPRQYEPLRSAFQDSMLPMKVDIVEWARISPRFRATVEAKHVVIAGLNGNR